MFYGEKIWGICFGIFLKKIFSFRSYAFVYHLHTQTLTKFQFLKKGEDIKFLTITLKATGSKATFLNNHDEQPRRKKSSYRWERGLGGIPTYSRYVNTYYVILQYCMHFYLFSNACWCTHITEESHYLFFGDARTPVKFRYNNELTLNDDLFFNQSN